MSVTAPRSLPIADLLPARTCNGLVYCPRLFHFEHVQGIFLKNAATRSNGKSDTASDAQPWPSTRTLAFTAPRLGTMGKVNIVEYEEGRVQVVEAKRGAAPLATDHEWKGHSLVFGAWPSDVAQVALHMAMVRENGLTCEEAKIHYRKSDTTRVVQWSDDLERFVHAIVQEARSIEHQTRPPTPLLDSPKCVGCSLQEVCLPDEHHAMLEHERAEGPIRQIPASGDGKSVLHLKSPGMVLRKRGETLVACHRDGTKKVHALEDVRHIAVYGPANITQPCTAHLLRSGVLISHHTSAGRLMGITQPTATSNISLRRAQFRAADDSFRSFHAARAWVAAKIVNQRTMLRRYRKAATQSPSDHPEVELALRSMKVSLDGTHGATDIEAMRGHDNDAAARYFDVLPSLLPPTWHENDEKRPRQLSHDRINALLDFGYSLLTRDAAASIARTGLDPMLGMYHPTRAGRASLALDVIEPFRAAWVDAAMLRLIATNGIDQSQFHVTSAGVTLTTQGRRQVIRAYERRAEELVTHPHFGYRASIRHMLDVDVRMLAKWLLGEIPELRPFSRR